MTTNIDELSINTLRTLAMDIVQKAGSGHPGTPMGAAPMAYVVWTRFFRHNPLDPKWPERDRFILSPGHASVLLYSLLHLTGYDLSLDDLKSFRQWGSRTPGHPEYGHTSGVEATTGPLGQGFAMGVGMAIAERFLADHFNTPGHTVVDHSVYGIVSDGDLMEGIASEAASLAGTLGLGKLIYLYDDNEISIEGNTDIAFTEQVGKRFDAYGWQVQRVDGNDIDGIETALSLAKAEVARPSLIITRTEIAYGSPHKAGSASAHGAPLGEGEVRLTKQALSWPEDSSFLIPPEVLESFRTAVDRGLAQETDWQARFDAYASELPDRADLWRTMTAGELPNGWDEFLPIFRSSDGPVATRVASGKALNGAVRGIPTLMGGSADLAPSTETTLKGYGDFGMDEWCGHNMHFGVREHAMAAIVNGLALHGGIVPYGATFLVFSDYLRPALRLAALMQSHSIFVFTHDSVGLGEDGPTHQPIEHLASMRAIPGLTVLRPADANETVACWRLALERKGPSALVLSRQNLPVLDDVELISRGVPRGAYVVSPTPGGSDQVVLLATGSEVSTALAARELLAGRGITARVVSMPSWEIFEEQDSDYRESVVPRSIPVRVSVEAASTFGWSRFTGDHGRCVGIDRFGASAPGPTVLEHLGITAENVAAQAEAALQAVASGGQNRGN
ncbi:MAG: transketolase [Dehalococcoidia bacterium]